MPVYGNIDQVSEGLRRRPLLPAPPAVDERVVSYLGALDKAIADFYDELSRRLQSYVGFTIKSDFGPADTTMAVVFTSPLEDDKYHPILTPSWNTSLWATGLTVSGFTINAAVPPGGSGGTVFVGIVR